MFFKHLVENDDIKNQCIALYFDEKKSNEIEYVLIGNKERFQNWIQSGCLLDFLYPCETKQNL